MASSARRNRPLRVAALLVGAAIVGAACGFGDRDVTDAINVPAGAALETTETTVVTAPTSAPTTAPTTELPEAEELAEAEEELALDSEFFTDTVPPAASETGVTPAYGGGNPTTSLVEALSITMPSVTGGDIDVSQYLGRDVVLWFWAPWCAWCNAEAPRVSAVANEFAGEIEVVGVAGVSTQDAMGDFVDRHELHHITHLADLDGHFWRNLDVSYQPWWMFINDTGEVVLNWQGRLSDEEIREVIDVMVSA